MKEHTLPERLLSALNLPNEISKKQVLTEIFGSSRVYIENQSGILAYCSDKIIVCGQGKIIQILGNSLEIIRMTDCQLIVTGNIRCVSFESDCHDIK